MQRQRKEAYERAKSSLALEKLLNGSLDLCRCGLAFLELAHKRSLGRKSAMGW